jgi:hypothetical protein
MTTATAERWAFHIGLDRIEDPEGGRRGLRLPPLNGVADARALALLTDGAGFDDVRRFLDDSARKAAVLDALGEAAEKLSPGSLLVLTYAGHGSQVPDDDGDGAESDGLDETWELYDLTLTDDELHTAFDRFRAGVAVVIVSDSCHSSSIMYVQAPPPDPRYVTLCQPVADPPAVVPEVVDLFAASMLCLSGCSDSGVAFEVNGRGVLSTALEGAWHDDPSATWAGLIDQTVARVDASFPQQRPTMTVSKAGKDLLDVAALTGPDH